MTRCHADPVEVVRRDDEPMQFLWRGRLHLVRAVLDHWVESAPWWRGPAVTALQAGARADRSAPGLGALGLADDREVWRVEAGAGRSGPVGVFDLTFVPDDGRWLLVRVHD
ncbi:MAG TPA: DUF6504 family protein [Mycobacteriales bacterium]